MNAMLRALALFVLLQIYIGGMLAVAGTINRGGPEALLVGFAWPALVTAVEVTGWIHRHDDSEARRP